MVWNPNDSINPHTTWENLGRCHNIIWIKSSSNNLKWYSSGIFTYWPWQTSNPPAGLCSLFQVGIMQISYAPNRSHNRSRSATVFQESKKDCWDGIPRLKKSRSFSFFCFRAIVIPVFRKGSLFILAIFNQLQIQSPFLVMTLKTIPFLEKCTRFNWLLCQSFNCPFSELFLYSFGTL